MEDDPDHRGYVGPPESRRLYWPVVTRPSVDGRSCWQPPWSRLVAVDVNSGEIAWMIPFGTVEPSSQKGGPTSPTASIVDPEPLFVRGVCRVGLFAGRWRLMDYQAAFLGASG